MPTLLQPLWLALPLAIIPVAMWWLARARAGRKRVDGFVPRRLRRLLLPAGAVVGFWPRHLFRFLLLLFLGLALARPQFGEEEMIEVTRARDILIAIDTSRSMLATDAAPSRLEAAKLAALDLLRTVPDDRVGVLAFAGTAFPLAPLTNDHEAVRETILGMDTESLPIGGTSLAVAIEAALETLDDTGPRQRALILLSDGEDLEGDLDGLAEKARKKGVLIFGFSIGTTRGSMVPSPKEPGGFIRDAAGQPVVSRASLEHLRELAVASGGYAEELASTGSLPGQFADGLARLEKAEARERTRSRATERFQWALAPALLLMIVCLFWPRLRFRAAPVAMCLVIGGLPPTGMARAEAPPPLPDDPVAAAAEALGRAEWEVARAEAARAMLVSPPHQRISAIGNFAGAVYEKGKARLPAGEEAKWKIEDMEKTIRDWEDALDHLDYGRKIPSGGDQLGDRHDLVAKALEELRKKLEDRREQERREKEQQEQQQQQQQEGKPEDGREGEGGQQGEQPGQPAEQSGQEPQPGQGNQKDQEGPRGGQEGQADPGGQGTEQENRESGQGGESEEEMRQRQLEANPEDLDPAKDASSGEAGGRTSVQAVPMRVGPDGRILLPADPAERNRLLENIRRNLENRSEERKVRLPPPDAPRARKPAGKDW